MKHNVIFKTMEYDFSIFSMKYLYGFEFDLLSPIEQSPDFDDDELIELISIKFKKDLKSYIANKRIENGI